MLRLNKTEGSQNKTQEKCYRDISGESKFKYGEKRKAKLHHFYGEM